MTAPATCPFCNTVAPAAIPGRRLICSRCGESFSADADAGRVTPFDDSPIASNAGEAQPPSWKAYLVPAGIGFAMFVLVFYFGLTAILRPKGTKEPTAPTDVKPAAASGRAALWPPSALSSLKFLPSNAQIAVVVQPAAFAEYAKREAKDPAELLVRCGVPKAFPDVLTELGLKFEDVSQLAAGLILPDDGLFPRGRIALVLRKPPPDEAAFLKALKAEPIAGPKKHFRVSIRNLPLTMSRHDDATFLFAFEADDLNLGIAGPGLVHLSAGLQESIAKLSPASFAWVAAEDADWIRKPLLALAAKSAAAAKLPKLDDLRAVALGLSLEPKPTLTTNVKRTGTDWVETIKPMD